MADTKISALTAETTLDGTEIIPYAKGGANGSVTAKQIADLHSIIPAYLSGRWYPIHPVISMNPGTGTPGAVRGFYTPFVPAHDVTVAQVMCQVWSTGAATVGSLAIYNSQISSNKAYPTGTAISSTSANFSLTTTGIKSGALSANASLTGGKLYFMALAVDSTVTMGISTPSISASLVGELNPNFSPSDCAWIDTAVTTVGTWPDLTTSPTGGTISSTNPYFLGGFKVA